MQRGVISLTKPEVAAAAAVKHIPPAYKPLHSKLQAAVKGSTTEVFLNRDEVEVMLDNLGIPQQEELKELASLRMKLRTFLQQLDAQGHI